MKKALSLVLAAMLMLSLSACKGEADDKDKTIEPSANASETNTASGSTAAAPPTYQDIFRYGISMPAEAPEFDEDFYAQSVDTFTDDVLAANRDKLEAAPTSTRTETLNRFTEYLNATEPGERTDSVQMTWFYVDVYAGEEDNETEFCKLVQVPLPVFEGGKVEMAYYSVTGAQSGSVSNAANVNEGSLADDSIFITFDSDSLVYETAKHAQESHEEYKREGLDNTLYMNYDEDTKTSVTFNDVTPSEESVYDPERECIIFQTIAEGCGAHDTDVLFNVWVYINGEPHLNEADVKVLRDYFAYMEIPFPDDSAWNIQ